MRAFTRLTGVAAPIDLANVDTDRVIPARFLRKPQDSAGYERYLFHDVRFAADGSERPEFVLNQAAYRGATILVAAENFGCGSSREAAVWALMAYGVRCVIAPSLGDIFHQNCLKNGLLPVILAGEVAAGLRGQLHARPGATITADLTTQTVHGARRRRAPHRDRRLRPRDAAHGPGRDRPDPRLRAPDPRVRDAPRRRDALGPPALTTLAEYVAAGAGPAAGRQGLLRFRWLRSCKATRRTWLRPTRRASGRLTRNRRGPCRPAAGPVPVATYSARVGGHCPSPIFTRRL